MIYISSHDDIFQIITEYLEKAKTEILVCSYLLTLPIIISHLVRAKKRGCVVKVMLDRDDRNILTRDFLRQNGIECRIWRSPRGILHAKYIVVDRANALVGSANLTHDAMNNSYEILVIVKNKRDVEKLVRSFEEEFRFSEI